MEPHGGTLFGVAPTRKQVRFQKVGIAQVSDSKVVQYDSETGWLDFLTQVAVLPLR